VKITNVFKVPEYYQPKTNFEYGFIDGASTIIAASSGIPPVDSLNIGKTVVQQIKVAQFPTVSGHTLQAEFIINSVKSAINKVIKQLQRHK